MTVKKEFAVYCTDRGDHKRRRIATAYLGVKPTGETTVSVAYNTFRRKPRDPVTQQLSALLETESVPFLAAYRLKDSGLRKREAWEYTWDLQRREDKGHRA